jgi:hypothetical protein
MARARCVRACTFEGRFWRVGEVYEGAVKPPLYFEALEDVVQDVPEPEEKPKRSRKKA